MNIIYIYIYIHIQIVQGYLRYQHQIHFMERCLSGSDWSSQFLRQYQLWYAKPGLSCRPTCRIGCRINNTRVFKLPGFVHWGSYYWRQPGRQAGGQQSLRQLLSSGLELCPLALLQLLSYRAQLWVLGTPYGFHTNWEQAMDSSSAHYQVWPLWINEFNQSSPLFDCTNTHIHYICIYIYMCVCVGVCVDGQIMYSAIYAIVIDINSIQLTRNRLARNAQRSELSVVPWDNTCM